MKALFQSSLQINLELLSQETYLWFRENRIVVARHIMNFKLSSGQFSPATLGIVGIAN